MSDPRHSVLTLYHDIPFDSDYNHTVLFPDVESQRLWFNTKVLQTSVPYTSMSYMRHTKGTIRIQSKMNLLTSCNYIGFYNPETYVEDGVTKTLGYEDVTYYCFVDSIEYINENTIEISYTIDQIQTWMFYYQLNPCYVEREHVRSDGIGEHRVAEGLDTGDYTTSGFESIDFWGWEQTGRYDLTNTGYIVIATQTFDGGTPNPKVINGVFGTLTVYNCVNTQEFQELLMNYANGATKSFDPIIAVYQIPNAFLDNSYSGIKDYNVFNLSLDVTLGIGGFRNWSAYKDTEDYYLPLNNKLYTYPYNFLVLESPDGSSIQLKYENFHHLPSYENHLGFIVYLAIFPEPETMCIPLDYESTQFMANIRSALCSKSYPTVPLSSSAFQAWWAQNRYSMPVVDAFVEGNAVAKNLMAQTGDTSKLSEYLTTTLDALTKMPQSMASSLQIGGKLAQIGGAASTWTKLGAGALETGGRILDEIGGQLASYEGHKAVPNTCVTKANNAGITHATHTDCYKVYYTQIRPEYARIIDRYFSVFGYAIKFVKVPDIESRVVWNYIKTVGCTIGPNVASNRFVPMEAEKIITKIYDRGITFWHWPELIHQYVHSYGTQDEPKMYNPIGTPYNFPGMPGYLPNPGQWNPPTPEPPEPAPELPTGTKIYLRCDAGWSQPYVIGFPKQGNTDYILPMEMEGINVWSIDVSLFRESETSSPVRPYTYSVFVFVNGNTAQTWTSNSNYYNFELSDNITPIYDLNTNNPIGAFYIGSTDPFINVEPTPTENYIYIKCESAHSILFVMNTSTQETIPMIPYTGVTVLPNVWRLALSNIASWPSFYFSTSNIFSSSTVSEIKYPVSTIAVTDINYLDGQTPFGKYYIGLNNPFVASTNYVFLNFSMNLGSMYIAKLVGQSIVFTAMEQITEYTGTGSLWKIPVSSVSDYNNAFFSVYNTTPYQTVFMSDTFDATKLTENTVAISDFNKSYGYGYYYVGSQNPFI